MFRQNPVEDRIERRQQYRETGVAAFAQYPLSVYHRVDANVGFVRRQIAYPAFTEDGVVFLDQKDNLPWVGLSATGDTTFYQYYGPHGGRRWMLSYASAFDVKEGGILSHGLILDARQYVPLSRRNELALRLWAAASDGNRPNFYYFGGIDTLRGYDYQSLAGNRAFHANLEWRFPLIDHLVLPWLHLASVRGRVFVDVGGAWFDLPGYTVDLGGGFEYDVPPFNQGFRFSHDGRLDDAVSSYGFGLSLNLFGLPAHWDFAKRWDFKESLDNGYRTEFWIGIRY
ncbi:MAG: BamA/TamA family outer membrane protein [Thermoanaerobaculaceae bacterium]